MKTLILLPVLGSILAIGDCDSLCPPWGNHPDCEHYDEGGTGEVDLPVFPAGIDPCTLLDGEANSIPLISGASSAYTKTIPAGGVPYVTFNGFNQAWNVPQVEGAYTVQGLDEVQIDPQLEWNGFFEIEGASAVLWIVKKYEAQVPILKYESHCLLGQHNPQSYEENMELVATVDGGEGYIWAIELKEHPGHDCYYTDYRIDSSNYMSGWTNTTGPHAYGDPGDHLGPNWQPMSTSSYFWAPIGGVCETFEELPSLDTGEV